MVILEEQFRYEIPTCGRYIDIKVVKELNRLYLGYEFIWHATAEKWVLYHTKKSAGCRSHDLMFKQFELPPAREPDMSVLKFMAEQDRSNECFKAWRQKTLQMQEEVDKEKAFKRRELTEAIADDAVTYQCKRKVTI